MTEILIVKSKGSEPTYVNTYVYKDGKKLDNVKSVDHSIKADEGSSALIIIYDINNGSVREIHEYYNEMYGDKVIFINFTNWRQYLEELRNEDSILLCQ